MIQVNASFKSTTSKLQKLVVSVLVRFFITQQLKVHKVVFCFQIFPNTFCQIHTHLDAVIKNNKVSLNAKVVFLNQR